VTQNIRSTLADFGYHIVALDAPNRLTMSVPDEGYSSDVS